MFPTLQYVENHKKALCFSIFSQQRRSNPILCDEISIDSDKKEKVFCEWLKQKVHVYGGDCVLQMPNIDDSEFEMIKRPTIEAISIAYTHNNTYLWIDDINLREYISWKWGIQTINTQDVLVFLSDIKAIDDDTYNEILIRMLQRNYEVVLCRPSTCCYAMQKDNWNIEGERLTAVMKIFIDERFSSKVMSMFAFESFKFAIQNSKAILFIPMFIDKLLDTMAKRNDFNAIFNSLQHHIGSGFIDVISAEKLLRITSVQLTIIKRDVIYCY